MAALSTCPRHPGEQVIALCVNCHRGVCPRCRVVQNWVTYCDVCYAETFRSNVTSTMFKKRDQRIGFPMAYWPFWEGLLVISIGLVIDLIVVAVLSSVFTYDSLGQVAVAQLIFSVVLYSVLIGGVYYFVVFQHQSPPASLGLKTEHAPGNLLWGLLTGAVALMGGLGLGYLSNYLLGNPPARDVQEAVSSASRSQMNWVYFILTVVVAVMLAPVFEEVFFRGFLYSGLRNKFGIQWSLVITSAFFAFVHFEVIGFLPRFFVGYVLGYIYEERRNLMAPITAHAVYNGTLLLLATFGILK